MAYYATYMPDETGEMQKVVINAGVGFVLPYYGETAPPGTLACDGSEISREAYKELFAVLGTKAGAGNGSTTFNVPDLRGVFIRGTGGNAAALGVEQTDAIQTASGSFMINSGGLASTYGQHVQDASGSFYLTNGGSYAYSPIAQYCQLINETEEQTTGARVFFDASRQIRSAIENRPVNVALLWCIIYE